MGQKGVTRRAFDADWMLFPEDREARLPSPVTTYTLLPEELAKLDKLPKPTGKAPIHIPVGKKRKEEETMPAIQMTEQEAREKLPPSVLEKIPVELTPADPNSLCQEHITVTVGPEPAEQKQPEYYQGSSKAHRFTPERIAQAEELLSREEYIRLKNEGVSDQKIIKDRDKFHYELLTALKKKWGVNIRLSSGPPRPQAKPLPDTAQPAQPKEFKVVRELDDTMPLNGPGEIIAEHRAQASPPHGLTIAQALELREELKDDLISIEHLISVLETGYKVTDRVEKLITWYRDEYQRSFDRLNEVFEKTVLPL